MKKILSTILSTACISGTLLAQCSFTPTVNGDTLLCPNSGGFLFTQSNYDSVQWYSRPYGGSTATAVSGATNDSLAINDATDLLYYFSVDASLGGCTERSAEVLVDGWVFMLPVVATTGDYTFGTNGESVVCEGDTIYFELMSPYNTNIVWTNDGNPIAGEDSTILVVTQAGNYSVSGAPAICPNFNQNLGVTLVVQYIACPTGIDKINAPKNTAAVMPNPAENYVRFAWQQPLQNQNLRIVNALGQTVWHLSNFSDNQLQITLEGWSNGVYWLQVGNHAPVKWVKG